MLSVQSFGFTADIGVRGQTVHIAGRFSAPSDLDEVVTDPSGTTTEVVFKGEALFTRTGTTGPFTTTATTTTTTPTDPRTAFSLLGRATGVTPAGGGYDFTLTGKDAKTLVEGATSVHGTATLTGGAITSLTYDSAGSQVVHVELRYTSIGTSPPVTAPPASAT